MEKVTAPYISSMKMRSLISDNSLLLMALSRFGISLGFADKSVEEVCRAHNVDCDTFLTVANFISGRRYDRQAISLESLMSYLKCAHRFFLDFQLPMIRRKLIEGLDCSGVDSLGFLIIRFYDEYTAEVRNHMEIENDHIFPYVDSLLQGTLAEGFQIDSYARSHTGIGSKLKELKDMIIRYYPEKELDLLNSALFDIITCEQDLNSHCSVEDLIFIPAVETLERRIRAEIPAESAYADQTETRANDTAGVAITPSDADRISSLSEREKEIVCLVARGLTNKEIAEQLFLSVHTVATHRRNIGNKLNIHSPAGLTIFAIVNGLLPISEIPRPA